MMKLPTNAYYDFVHRIKTHGTRFPKKHGEWYRVRIKSLRKWVTLDTWNGSICVHEGKCEPSGNDVYGNLCFHSKSHIQIGFNLGEFYQHPWMDFYRLHLPPASEEES